MSELGGFVRPKWDAKLREAATRNQWSYVQRSYIYSRFTADCKPEWAYEIGICYQKTLLPVSVCPGTKVGDLLTVLEYEFGVIPNAVELLYEGSVLSSASTLGSQKIQKDAIIFCVKLG